MKPDGHLMQVWEGRPLSEGEISLGRTVFADEIDWDRVRVKQVPAQLGFGAMVPIGKTILFAKWRAWRNFARAPIGEQGWFVHELMHVWQAGRGVLLAGAKLGALGKGAYAYKPRTRARLADYNIERQAEIARHLYLARAGKPEAEAPPQEWLEAAWARR